MNVTLRQLRVFASVARHLSFVRAAEELSLTPPAVSMQIKELESQVGLPLFDRTSRNVSLTTVGEYLLVHARRVLAVMRDAEDMVARFRGLQEGPLDIAMVSTAKYFLPRMLALFRQEHPGVEVRLQVAANREQIVSLLQQGAVELAVMGRPPAEWPTRAEPFAMHPHVLVTAPEHRFAHSEHVPAAALANEAFIVREAGSGTRAVFDEYMRAHRLAPRMAMQMSSNEAIKQAVMAGMGVTFLSAHTVSRELQSGALCILDVQGFPLMLNWYVVHRRTKRLPPVAQAFKNFLLADGADLIAQALGEKKKPPRAAGSTSARRPR